ncbi:hypothetical protein BS47DRAFT_1347980 [Hydnum rufescens UP504]|uniref:Peroxisomal ATPase PEX1 n=1 Tax=Hydnum rufescens UP504 TaxID=1448309 RepID=A0A9P6DTD4_9AGAM|nr:hypothetical protein BS47DRAFT_1347980 [Hydnum rufescens UP504]
MYGPLASSGVRPQGVAVHLLRPASPGSPTKEAYVGWTGFPSASSLAQFQSQNARREGFMETVEIDPQYAQALGFAEGITLEIGLLHGLAVAKSISTEPYSADDWEILELHAQFVENNLLSQVRAACVGQEIDVWVLGRTRIRFRVVSTDPPSSSRAVLLSTDTEVSIAPKLRNGRNHPETKAKSSTQAPSNTSSDSSAGPKSSKLLAIGRPIVLRVLPSRVAVLPESPDELEDIIAYVSPSTLAGISNQDLPLASPNLTSSASIRRLKPPTTLGISSIIDASASAAPPPVPPAAKLIQPKDGKVSALSGTVPGPDQGDERVVLYCLSGIPEHHILVRGALPNLSDWDLVLVSPEARSDLQTNVSSSGSSIVSRTDFPHASRTSDLAGQPIGSPIRATSGIPGLLICGAPGSGRTSIAKEAVKRLESDPRVFSHHLYADLAKLADERVAAVKALFDRWLDIASWHKPSILVLDNLDRVVGPEVEHADSSRQRQLAEHFLSSFSPARAVRGVILIATCQNQSTLHPLLASAHIFSERVTLRAPSKEARRDIIAQLVDKQIALSDLSQDPAHPINYIALATQTEGYSATDLRDLAGRAIHQAAIRSLEAPQDTPLQKSEVEWSDIGGLHETRRVLRETLEWPTKYGAIFCQILLLYGFPGCGKTLLASAVAKECGLNFISVKGPELLNKYIGASEKSVRDLFDRATAAKPCILFFDEFDSIAPKRGHDSTGVTDRVVNQMLTQMDGAEGLDGVYVLAATSRPDLIDPALLRPGRLDKSLLCDMPNAQERARDTIDVAEYAQLTEGFSGADLQALVYNAHLDASSSGSSLPLPFTSFGGAPNQTVLSRAEQEVQQRRVETIMASLNQNENRTTTSGTMPTRSSKPIVLDRHLQQSLKNTQRLRLSLIYQGFVSDRSGNLPIPPDAGGIGSRASLG